MKNRKENQLLNLPILGYILRKIKENLSAIARAFRTGKEIPGKTRERSFLGILRVVSGKTFSPLKLKKTG